MTNMQGDRKDSFYKFYTPTKVNLLNNVSYYTRKKNQNRDFYSHYMNIVKKCAILFREFKIKDSITASAFFQYLLWNGYFSKDKILTYSMSGRTSLIGALGADIMTGKSVCENNAEMLKDILNSMNFKAYIMGCILNIDEPLDITYRPRIYCPRNDELSLTDKIFNKFVDITSLQKIGNHMVTLIKSEDSYYISDPTNLVFFNFDEVLRAKVVGGTVVIDIKPWVSLVFDTMSNEEFMKIMNGTFASINKRKLEVPLIKEVCRRVEYEAYYQSALIDSFYDDIRSDINEVCKKLCKEK